MKKLICMILALVMIIGLVACGGNKNEYSVESAEPVIGTVPVTYTEEDWQFYVESGYAQSESMGRYFVAMHKLRRGKAEAFMEFLQDQEPIVTEAFLDKLNSLNAIYKEMEDIYFGTSNGEERYMDVTVKDYLSIEAWYGEGNGIVTPALTIIQHDQAWYNSSPYVEYDDGKWVIKDVKGIRYTDGLLEIDDFYCLVVWHDDNISEPEQQHDDVIYTCKNGRLRLQLSPEARGYRCYNIIDPSQDTYCLVYSEKSGWHMLCIEATDG